MSYEYEMPVDQIKQLQILLRKEANLSWYHPENEESLPLPKLSSVAETVAKLDPSPPYLRCKNCNGRLLLGVQSFTCVFCGTNPHAELPPEPIKFKNTLGYRWLLESLSLDGSEMVTPMEEENTSHRGRTESKDEIPISKLLDLEIRWPSEAERGLSSNSDSAGFTGQSSLHLADVDLDSFFDRKESDSEVSELNIASGGKAGAASDNTFQDNENLSLFQNAQASQASAKDQDDDSFSGWEANFKSASSGHVQEESKSVGHSNVELDAVSGNGKDSVGVRNNDDFNPSAASEDDWFQGGEWRTSNSEVHSQSVKSETTVDLNHTKTTEIENSSSTRNLDWMQDNQWQESENKTPDIVATDEDDSFDIWNDFTGSVSTQDPSGIITGSKITEQTGKSGFSTDLNDSNREEGADNAFERDFESNITYQIGNSGFNADLNDTTTAEDANSSCKKGFDWMQDDQWQNNNNKLTDNISNNEAADSFDAWDVFTGSATTSNSVLNSEVTGQSGKFEFELTKDLNDTKTAESATSSFSNFDWMQNDQWQGSNNKATGVVTTNEVTDSFDAWNDFTGSAISQNPPASVSQYDITGQTRISEITGDPHDTKTAEAANASSAESFDWMQNDQWQVSNNKTTDTAATNNISDPFDVWSDSTSFPTTQDPSSNIVKQAVNQTHSENTFEMNLFSSSNNSIDMDFSGFSQQKNSEQFNNPPSTPAAASNRVADVDTTIGNPGDVSTAEVGSKDDVDILMSEIHDLSFMLESNLSFPPK